MSSSLKGWHPGETAIQSQLQYSSAVNDAFELFANSLPAEQRAVINSQLTILPLVTLDPLGRPWVSLLTSPTGSPGFVSSPAENGITVRTTLWDGDPLHENLRHAPQNTPGTKILVAGAAVNLDFVGPRNKFSGTIKEIRGISSSLSMDMEVDQVLGNRNKYLCTRGLDAHPDTSPFVEFSKPHMGPAERLPDKLIELIHRADTTFFGTSYVAAKRDEARFPSRLSLNHRGGNPGFLRVRPSDGRTIAFPDYSGNHMLNSLGNIEATPVASLTIPCFTSGDILYLTGNARNYIGSRAQSLMRRVNVLTTVKITGYVYIRDALPFRERDGTVVHSRYCPPIRFLNEEKPIQTHYKNTPVQISQVVVKTQDIATFTFKTSKEVLIKPGEWAMLDFSSIVGRPAFVAENERRELNDDRIRTWTVSSFHSAPTSTFEITIQRKPFGLVTNFLLDFAHKAAGDQMDVPIFLKDKLPGQLRLVSIGGDFDLAEERIKLLWISGGIGISPFISLVQAIQLGDRPRDIILLFATRLPDAHMQLLTSSLSQELFQTKGHRITIHLFSNVALTVPLKPVINLHYHPTRFTHESLSLAVPDIKEREISVCCSSKLLEVALDSLIRSDVNIGKLKRESFIW